MLQPKLLDVKPLPEYRVLLHYATGEKKVFDVTPYISGEWFGKLKDVNMFNTVRLSGNTIEWAGGQDIAPHELYDLSVPTDDTAESA